MYMYYTHANLLKNHHLTEPVFTYISFLQQKSQQVLPTTKFNLAVKIGYSEPIGTSGSRSL